MTISKSELEQIEQDTLATGGNPQVIERYKLFSNGMRALTSREDIDQTALKMALEQDTITKTSANAGTIEIDLSGVPGWPEEG